MNLSKINQISSKFQIPNDFLLYQGIFNPFIDIEEDVTYMYACRGIRFNYDFAKKVYNYYNIKNVNILKAISASYIMNEDFNLYLFKNYTPDNFWFPKTPSKEFCYKLIEINEKFAFLVALLSIYNNWMDLFDKCKVKNKDKIFDVLIKNYDVLIKHSVSKIYELFNVKLDLYIFHFFDGFINLSNDFEIEDPYDHLEIYEDDGNGLCFVNSCSIDTIIIKNDFVLPYFDFKLEDIKYNLSLAYYICSNHSDFSHKQCSRALSTLFSNQYINFDLIKKYDIFYLTSYRFPYVCSLEILVNNFKHLHYNVAAILCFNFNYDLYQTLDLEPDLDILSIAEFYRCNFIRDDMLAKYNECEKWYRHMSFEEEKNIPSTEVTYSSKINFGNIFNYK